MSQTPGRSIACLKGALALSVLLSVLPSISGAQSLPLDDKARYERSLETKAEEILLKLLGPNQVKVVVQASMDFTRTEKLDVVSGTAGGGDQGKPFKWESTSAEAQPFNNYLLPGFPVMDSNPSDAKSYQKQMLFPSSFVKKMDVSVIVNKNMPETEIQNVRTVVAEILGLNQARGDQLSIIKASFAPFWKTIWYTPEALNLVFKYIILTIMGIVAMIVVSIGFLKLAAAMNTMAKAQQNHQITMDLGKGPLDGGAGLPMPDASGPGALGLSPAEKAAAKESEAAPPDKVVFNIRLDQTGFLVDLMNNEDPANVALVAGHLSPDVRSEFLRRLSPDFSSDVIAHMAKVRFVEPDIINTIKDELERRLSGALGGIPQVVEVLGLVNLRAKRDMLDKLAQKDPATAQLVRQQIFLPEDLELLSSRDISVLVTNFKIETLATALWALPQSLKDILKEEMAEKTWKMVEQTMTYGAPSRESSEDAVEELLKTALRLMKEDRISNPMQKDPGLSGKPSITLTPPASGLAEAQGTPGNG